MSDPDPEDRDLLRRCVEGDRRAWNRFVERFSRYVYYLVQLTGRRYSAQLTEEDVADQHNDVFLALLEDDRRRLRAFEGRNGCSVRSWIRVIAIRRTLDALRRRRGHLSLDAAPDEGGVPEPVAHGPDPFEALLGLETRQRWGRLHELVSQLGPADQLLLQMLYVDKLSVPEAAAALSINRGALYTRKTRIIKRLRRLAESEGLVEVVA